MFTDLGKSANYQFCFGALKEGFFHESTNMDELYNNNEKINVLTLSCVMMLLLARGIRAPKEYLELPVHFVEKEDRKGFVLEIPDPKFECECNYVALIQTTSGEKQYYTSEFYAFSNKFMLCKNTPEQHMALSTEITCLQDMIDAV